MTRDQKIDAVRSIIEDVDDSETLENVTLGSYLDLAGQVILSKLYPFEGQSDGKAVPERYEGLQIRIAVYWINKRGAEGEIQHIENGIHRNYGSSDIPEAMLKEIVPFAKVVV